VEEVILDHFITEEDVVAVSGGLEALEDDATRKAFMDEHFDDLLEKYNDELLEYFREYAAEAASEDFQERYEDHVETVYEQNLEWQAELRRDRERFGENLVASEETLEEFDDQSYYDNLAMCPECGADKVFDHSAGFCIGCGHRL
jgi:hypothetical protein